MKDNSLDILSDIIIFMKYAKFIPSKKRRETWTEIVDRNKKMHIKKYPILKHEIEEAYKLVYDKKVLPSMRSLQFAGKAIEVNPARIYNCCALPISEPEAFSEILFLLLAGVGVGISVQFHHIRQLPEIYKPKKTRRHLIEDSIEGWATAIKVLIEAYMGNRTSLPIFDYSVIRPKGSPLKTSGGIAPGSYDLKVCLTKVQNVLDQKDNGDKLTPLEAHDLICHLSDCVLSGGIRRSALISLFSLNDTEMLAAKFGEWDKNDPQRGRANNSAVLLRHKIKDEVFYALWDKIKESGSGEPGIFFTNDKSGLTNPCAEISLNPYQFCNLTEINVSNIQDQKDLNHRARVAAFIGTLQAGHTDFHYLREIWKDTTEKEALLGVSMTGIAAGKVLELDMKEAANEVKVENTRVSSIIKVNSAARCTTVKPSGTSSLVAKCSSGIHAYHSEYYIRRIRVGKEEAIYKHLKENHPDLVEDDFFKAHDQAQISVPVKAPDNCITRKETALQSLDRFRKVYRNWIIPGHRDGLNRHNISCTITIKPNEWDKVGKWMWENKENFTALSVLPYDGGSYIQAPFEEITEQIYKKMVKQLKQIDLTKIKETEDNTNPTAEAACGGKDSCEII